MSAQPSNMPELTEALSRTLAVAEFSPDGILVAANGNYRTLLGYEDDAILGRTHRSFCDPSYAASNAYTEFWQSLVNGHPLIGAICERQRRDGSPCWLGATFTPIFDSQQRVHRIVKVALDITERQQQWLIQNEHARQLALVADTTDSGVVIVDNDGSIHYVNAGFIRMFGWGPDEIAGRTPADLLGSRLSEAFIQPFRAELMAGTTVRREEILTGKNGQRSWVNVVVNPILDPDGNLSKTVSVLTDITHVKMYEVLQQRALEAMAREEPLQQVLNMVCLEIERILPDVTASIQMLDDQGHLQPLASPSLPPEYWQLFENCKIGPEAGSCGTAAYRGEPVWTPDIATDPLWDEWRHMVLPMGYTACWSTPILSSDRQVMGTFAFYYRKAVEPDSFQQQVITACVHLCMVAFERERARQRIQQLAFYDSLTGLPNRRMLLERANHEITTLIGKSDQLAVLFIDLDRFKQINDSIGRAVGDELLREMANRIRTQFPASDLISRLSGDEFVAVLPRCSDGILLAAVTQLQETLSQPCRLAETCLMPSATIGIAVFPADGRNMETLLQCAEMAMYQAKTAGRGQYGFFNGQMSLLAQKKISLEAALRDAIRTGSLCLHYQPQVSLEDRHLYGVEALARWFHPELGMIPPSQFIPLAEECGLTAELGRWVLHEACRQLGEWQSRGLTVPSVSINLSPTSFRDPDLPQTIARTLEDHALPAEKLTLEVTEGVLLEANSGVLKTIKEVTALGVRLSVDDFGTGYSSLSYLRRLPVSELKLDRSFVADLAHDKAASALSAAIMGIGQSLNLTLIAEGVETEEQSRILAEQGYGIAQGYLFSPALPPKEFEHWIEQVTGSITPA
jgi:diguanylate cyclase (GGDEF)-like protein/PAS domain S-box-containing protein